MSKKKVKKVKKTGKSAIRGGDTDIGTCGMNGNRIFIQIGKTMALPGYESLRIEYGRLMTIPDGVGAETIKNKCMAEVMENITEMVDLVKKTLS